MRSLLRLLCAAGLAVSVASSAEAVQYRIIDLGGAYSGARAINNRNQVVGLSCPGGGPSVITVWDSTVPVYLTTPGSVHCQAWSINDSGDICGCVYNEGGTSTAFVLRDGQMTLIDGMSQAYCINNAGQIVGDGLDNTGKLWSEATGIVTLAAFADEAPTPLSINNVGNISGMSAYWSTPTEVTDLRISSDEHIMGTGINDRGQVVGNNMSWWPERTTAFVWDPVTGRQTLPGLLGVPSDINNRGDVITCENEGARAWFWSNGECVELPSLSQRPNLCRASSINDNGWICGIAWDDQDLEHAVLWVPVEVPEPASITPLIAGIAGIGGFAIRRRK